MESDTTKERLYLFDNLKFLLILFVVIGHVVASLTEENTILQSEFLFIYSFHMPLFVFISGLFQKSENNTLNYNKIANFVVLGLTLKIGIMLIDSILFKDKISFSLLDKDGVFWYLFVMASYNVICYLLRDSNKKFVLGFSIALALLVGYDKTIRDYLCLSRTVVFFPFYYVGFCLTPKKVAEALNKRWIRVLSIVLLVVWLYFVIEKIDLVYALRLLFTGRNPYSKVHIKDCSMWHRLLAMSISSVLCVVFLSLTPRKRIPIVSSIGTKTLQIYFWHGFVIRLLEYFDVLTEIERVLPNSCWIAFAMLGLGITLLLSFDVLNRPLKAICNSVNIQPKSL